MSTLVKLKFLSLPRRSIKLSVAKTRMMAKSLPTTLPEKTVKSYEEEILDRAESNSANCICRFCFASPFRTKTIKISCLRASIHVSGAQLCSTFRLQQSLTWDETRLMTRQNASLVYSFTQLNEVRACESKISLSGKAQHEWQSRSRG